jgi:adenylate cyclase
VVPLQQPVLTLARMVHPRPPGGFRRQADIRAGNYLIENISPVLPRRDLREATPWDIGFVDMRRDMDGFIRTYPLQVNHQGVPYFSLALQMMPLVLGEDVEYINEQNHYTVAGRRMTKTPAGRMLINYYGGYRSFEYISLESVVDDEDFQTTTEMLAFEVNEFDHPEYGLLHQGVLEGKVVLVGATMPELQDFHQVPFPNHSGEKTMAGVEVHAHALQNLIDGAFLRELNAFQDFLIAFLVLLISFAVTYFFIGWSGLIAAIFTGAGWGVLSLFVFLQFDTILPIMPVFLAILLGYTGSTLQNVLFEVREKQKIKSMFSTYLSPELVDRMVADEISYKLGGSVEKLTVLFSDIEDFTLLSELLAPNELVSVMNRYLNELTGKINEHHGTLDKYIGDAVMSFFGAPIQSESHAADACRASLSSSITWSDEILEQKSLVIKTRYGINTGEMLVGNVGSERRFNYTVMGDQVNIGARCEAACKIFGVYRIVSEITKVNAEQTGEFVFRELGSVRVKGKREPVRLHQLVCFRNNATEEVLDLVKKFEEALKLFYERDFSEARGLFSEVQDFEESHLFTESSQNPSSLYIKKCDEMKNKTPDSMWMGVVEG